MLRDERFRVPHIEARPYEVVSSTERHIWTRDSQIGSVPVSRAQDKAKPAKGLIYMIDPINNPTLIRGVGTDFEKEAKVGGMIFLPLVEGKFRSSVYIAYPDEFRTKRLFKGKL
ncbi:hypothetical protein F4680DRAFT_253537 [Xylaria scruposa]|nr:hypothetical protein F4680DRAFT_253537 [Xylaria scruposa]